MSDATPGDSESLLPAVFVCADEPCKLRLRIFYFDYKRQSGKIDLWGYIGCLGHRGDAEAMEHIKGRCGIDIAELDQFSLQIPNLQTCASD